MGRRLALAALILLSPSCTPGKTKSGTTRENADLSIRWEITDAETLHPRQGDLATIRFTITNESRWVVVLKNLTFLADPRSRETASAVATWQRTRTGTLTYTPARDSWKYVSGNDPLKIGYGATVFNSGLLAPGESTSVTARVQLIRMPRIYHVLYFRLTPAELRQKVYFEVREGGKTEYRTLLGPDLARVLAPGQGRRVVLFPHAEGPDRNARIEVQKMDMKLRNRAFSLSAAASKAGVDDPSDVAWCDALDGWILPRGKDNLLVTSSGITPLPTFRQPARITFYVDSTGLGKLEIEFLRETKSLFTEQYGTRMVAVSPPSHQLARAPRFLLFLPTRELLPFLQVAREVGLDIDVEILPGGGGRLLVTR